MGETLTLRGPGGIKIELDASEIFPDDPGNGTPAMVFCGKHGGTFWCALDTGELGCGDYELTDEQHRWLQSRVDAVNDFIDVHSP
jgi:hypothetical protein